jgi:hypothetical protein
VISKILEGFDSAVIATELCSAVREAGSAMTWAQANHGSNSLCAAVEGILIGPGSFLGSKGFLAGEIHIKVLVVETPKFHQAAQVALGVAPLAKQQELIEADVSEYENTRMRAMAQQMGMTVCALKARFQDPRNRKELSEFKARCQAELAATRAASAARLKAAGESFVTSTPARTPVAAAGKSSYEVAAELFFKDKGAYPKWDPLKRKPVAP